MLSDVQKGVIKDSIIKNYYSGWKKKENFSPEVYENDVLVHLHKRTEEDRQRIIPWLDSVHSLDKSNILEIGCGTGSSTVALSEQGATVTGIDVEAESLQIARTRCEVYGLKADFFHINASDIDTFFSNDKFDFIIFFASLEHMKHEERMDALKKAWNMLEKEKYLAIIETPNRLWYHDGHSSLLPFFNWLPDRLAFEYAKFSDRDNYGTLFSETNVATMDLFYRYGRGVSYHEFELAIGKRAVIQIESCLHLYENTSYYEFSKEKRYMDLLKDVNPDIHPGFFFPSLDIIIKKD